MSDDNGEAELRAMEEKIEELAQAPAPAAVAVEEPLAPQPQEPAPQANEDTATPPEPVAPTAQVAPSADDPQEWANKKGFKTREDVERSLRNLEEEFHRRNQAGHPGYRDIQNGNPAPPPPPPQGWTPQPQGFTPAPYGYPTQTPRMPSRADLNQELAKESGIDPEDLDRLMPIIVKVSSAISARDRAQIEGQMVDLRRQASRSSEFLQLSQDPAFSDQRVQKEMHEVLKDGQIFQRSGSPYVAAFQIALANIARKQLQQGNTNGNTAPTNMPPVTAGGGNGSSQSIPTKITEKDFARWSVKDQEAFINSNGRIVPKR